MRIKTKEELQEEKEARETYTKWPTPCPECKQPIPYASYRDGRAFCGNICSAAAQKRKNTGRKNPHK